MIYKPVKDYFMPRDWGIAFIVHSYLHFLCSCFSGFKINLGLISIKVYSTLPRALELEPCHHPQDTLCEKLPTFRRNSIILSPFERIDRHLCLWKSNIFNILFDNKKLDNCLILLNFQENKIWKIKFEKNSRTTNLFPDNSIMLLIYIL